MTGTTDARWWLTLVHRLATDRVPSQPVRQALRTCWLEIDSSDNWPGLVLCGDVRPIDAGCASKIYGAALGAVLRDIASIRAISTSHRLTRMGAAQCSTGRPGTPQGTPGHSTNEDNPSARQGGSDRGPGASPEPMDNQAAGAGRCFAHRTGSAIDLPTVLGGR